MNIKYKYIAIRRKFLYWILRKILNNLTKDNEFVRHANKEFNLADYNDKEGPNNWIRAQVTELLQLLSLHGHSGNSIHYAINLFSGLAKFEIISPLTLNDDEFSDCEFKDGTYQNKRLSKIFKNNRGIYNIDAFVKNIVSSKYINSDKLVKSSKGSCNGTIFEHKNGIATGRGFSNCYFKQKDIDNKRLPLKTISISVTEIEVKKDDWLMFASTGNKQLQELISLQNIDWFEVPSLKNLPIVELTSNHGY